jgi:hypothetical protein
MSCGSGMYRYMTDRGSGIFYSGSRIRTCFHPGSRIRIYFHPGSASNKPKNWFLSYQIYGPDCSSRILVLFFTHQRSMGQKCTRSRIQIRKNVKKIKIKKRLLPGQGKTTTTCPALPVLLLDVLVENFFADLHLE